MSIVAFRVDSSTKIGAGHVTRCLALAERLRDEGVRCHFIGYEYLGNQLSRIQQKGFHVWALPTEDSDVFNRHGSIAPTAKEWAMYDWKVDISDCAQILGELIPEWLVVDHYGIDYRWESMARQFIGKMLVIEDAPQRRHDCNLLITPAFHLADQFRHMVPRRCNVLAGPRYAFLRKSFQSRTLRSRSGEVKRVLVFFGSGDTSGGTLKALNALSQTSCFTAVEVDVIVGAANPHRHALTLDWRETRNVNLYEATENMADLMERADLFIGAGGASSWERCCMGLPGIVMATADNQWDQSERLAKEGAQIFLGLEDSTTSARLANVIEAVVNLPELLVHMSERCARLVDGGGVGRIVPYIVGGVTLRRATEGDSEMVLNWRNAPGARQHSLDTREIDRGTHKEWFTALLRDPNRVLLIAEHGSNSIGVLRLDIDTSEAEATVSIYLAPAVPPGQGWGKRLLLAGERWLLSEHPHVRSCKAEILSENRISLALFRALGYETFLNVLRKQFNA